MEGPTQLTRSSIVGTQISGRSSLARGLVGHAAAYDHEIFEDCRRRCLKVVIAADEFLVGTKRLQQINATFATEARNQFPCSRIERDQSCVVRRDKDSRPTPVRVVLPIGQTAVLRKVHVLLFAPDLRVVQPQKLSARGVQCVNLR